MLVKGTPGNRDVLSHAFVKPGQPDLWIMDQLRKPHNIAPKDDKFGKGVMNKSPPQDPKHHTYNRTWHSRTLCCPRAQHGLVIAFILNHEHADHPFLNVQPLKFGNG